MALSSVVFPTNTRAVSGATATEATGATLGSTNTDVVPLTPSTAAVIVAKPTVSAVVADTTPVSATLAITGASLAQLATRPVTPVPPASRAPPVTSTPEP